MNTNIKINYRYPGSRPFNDTNVDRCLFFGRDREKRSLLHKVLAGNLVVLYAKSGLGKTSLINAGLNQALRDRAFIPLKVRFNNPGIEPLQGIYTGVREIVKHKGLDYEAGEEDTLWQFFKTVSFWSEDDTLLKPVLILDQFEEFFVLHSFESRKQFIRQLADIISNNIPKELQEVIQAGEPFPYSEKPPIVKIIISIREDYLGGLEEMAREIPDILHRRFRLLPLNCEQARQAIIEPSQLQDESISASPFQYSADAVDMMLNFLCKRKVKDGIKITNEVEPFQLQLLCKHIEDKVRERGADESGDIIVKRNDLGGETGMQHVLQKFYDNQVERLDSIWKIKRARKLCEKGLISAADRRLSLEEDEIKHKFKISETLLAELVNYRLLRSEPRVGSIYYELSHDTLVTPIRESQKSRKFKRNTVGGIIAVCTLIVMTFFLVIPNLTSTENLINKKYEEALELKNKGEYYKAIAKFNAVLEFDDKFDKAYVGLGQLHIDKGDFDKAIEVYQKAINNGIKDGDIYYRLGQSFLARSNRGEAIRIYKDALIKNIKSPDIYRELAVLHIKNGNPNEAIDVYRQALKANISYVCIYKEIVKALKKKGKEDFVEKVYEITSKGKHKDASCYLDIGHHYIRLKKYDKAIENFKKAKEYIAGIAKAEASCGLGNALCYKGKHSNAIKEFKNALDIDDDYAEAYNGWGNALNYLNKANDAIEKYERAIKIKSDYADAYNGKGNALKSQQKYDEAIIAYKKAIELDPRNAFAYYGWGNILYSKKRYQAAIEKYEKAVEIKPDFAYAHNELGAALLKKRKYRRAVEEFQKATEFDPGYAEAYYNMGFALRLLKQYSRAIEAYNRAIQIKYDLPWAHMELGNALYYMKRYNKAIKAYKEAIKINPGRYTASANKAIERVNMKMGIESPTGPVSPNVIRIPEDADYFYNLGNDDLQEKEYEEAIKAFHSAIRLDSKHVDAHEGLAFAYLKLKRYNEAIVEYRQVIEIQPDNADAYKDMGDVLSFQKRYLEAIKAYKKAIDIQFDFTAAYETYVKLIKSKNNETREAYLEAIRNNPLDITPRVELAEFYLIAGDFNGALRTASELLREEEATGRRIAHEYRMTITFVLISSLFLLGEKPEALAKTHQFFKAYEKIPEDYRRSWSYTASKRYISQNEKLPREQTHLLLQMIDILESPKPKGMKKLLKLREAIQKVVRPSDLK
jgi:tetratricopeptide (TPR) repeat protein